MNAAIPGKNESRLLTSYPTSLTFLQLNGTKPFDTIILEKEGKHVLQSLKKHIGVKIESTIATFTRYRGIPAHGSAVVRRQGQVDSGARACHGRG
jgi:hypothetical protein